jgi:hypothetical protein
MARKVPFNIVGGAYADDALPWSAQDCVNYIPVFAEKDGTRSPKMLRELPGCVTFSADMAAAPVRGLHDCEGALFAVVGTTLYRVDTDGDATALGTIPGTERVTMAHNQITAGNQIAIGNGQSGYVWDTTTSTLVQITDDGFPGFRSVDFIDQYIIGVEPFGRYWFHSDLSDATSYNTIDRNVAEKLPDNIQQVIASGGDVFVLGDRSAQFFANTGAATGTWANRPGTEMDVGAASPWTACRLDNSVFWLGNDGTVYKLEGYQPRRISTHALEQAFSRADTSKAYAFTFEDRGHKVYYLTVGGKTWGYDVATGEWHRRKSSGIDFWRMNSLVKWRRRWYGGDYTNGKLYLLDWAVMDEAGEEMERSRTSPVLHDELNKLIVHSIEFLFDTGLDEESVPLPQPVVGPLSISGDVPDGFGGAVISTAYVASGGVHPITFTVTAGTFPAGITLATNGTVSGTLTASASYSWTVTATDAEGNTASINDTATVRGYWNAADRINDATGSMVLTNSNRDAEAIGIVASPTSNLGVRGELGRTTGRYYVEFEVLAENATYEGFVGLANATANLAVHAYQGANTVGHDFQNRPSSGLTGSAIGTNVITGSIVGVAVDLTARHAWVHVNGTYAFGQTPVTDPSGGAIGATMPTGQMFPLFTAQDTTAATSNKVRLRLLSSQMQYLPATFTAWGGS